MKNKLSQLVEDPNGANSTCNCKKSSTVFETLPTMCIIDKWKKNMNKVGCHNRVESAKMC
jgi:hypothetical protein